MNDRKRKKKLTHDKQEIYWRLGYLVHLSQMIEWNLLDILVANKFFDGLDKLPDEYYLFEYNDVVDASNKVYEDNDKSPLGKLLEKAVKDKIFTEEFVALLNEAKTRRNKYIHHIFKDDLKENVMDRNPKYFLKDLNETIWILLDVNETLLSISKDYKAQGKEIKSLIANL